jgi:hypothetical protein
MKETTKGTSQLSRRLSLLRGISFVVIVIVAIAALLPQTTQQILWLAQANGQRATGIGKVLHSQNYGTWDYSALKDDALNSWISINYKHDSVADLNSYVAANKALIPEVESVGGRAEVAISFFPTMRPDQFRAWAKKYGLQVREAQIAAGRNTMIIGGKADDPLPQASIDEFPYVGLNGVFGAYGTVPTNKLSSIAADPQVFLLDVTPAWTRNDLVKAGIAEAAQPKMKVMVDLAYGWMQQLDMIPTPTPFPPPVGTVSPQVIPTAP